MKKEKVEKANKTYLYYDIDNIYDYLLGFLEAPDPGCLDFEEKLLTNFRNKNKVKRK